MILMSIVDVMVFLKIQIHKIMYTECSKKIDNNE